ncbi:C25 family cysteine peptidase [candidate division KSB1 bacterium]
MRRIIYTALACLLLNNIYGQEWISIIKQQTKQNISESPAQITLLSSDQNTSVIRFSFDRFQTIPVKMDRKKAIKLKLKEATPLLYKGAPDLLKITVSIIIPDLDDMQVKVISSNYKDFLNINIAPSKGNLTRDIDPSTIPYSFGSVYSQNTFFPGKLAELRNPYIMRDYRGQTVIVYPFQYNPVTKTLRVYYDITLKVNSKGVPGKNPFIRNLSNSKIDPEFKEVYQSHFLNYKQDKYTPLADQGNMLIICYGSFMSAMQPFVNWKNKIGISTEIVNISNVGNSTSTAIKSFVTSYYNNNGLTFLLLVGDAAQIPTINASAGDSDNSYAYITGNDHYPEFFVGRFSAENVAQVQTQVQRTIDYEGYPSISGGWHSRAIGIASNQGPGDDNEYDHEHIHNIRTDLLGYTYASCSELYDGTNTGTGWIDAAGDPSASMVATDINNGASVISYCGHGSTTSWGTSGFSSSNVNALNNEGMLPFIMSVACINGNFVGNTCFAEAWLRATNSSGNPTGAIAAHMSTINQSWDPPMEAQDEMIDILTESYNNNIKRTFGGITMNGCMKMNDSYSNSGNDMTDTWTIFGDPSLMLRTDTPMVMTVTHPNTVIVGSSQIFVACNVNDAYVSLTINNQIIGTGIVTGGLALINYTSLSSVDTMTVAVTAYNYIPYFNEIPILPSSGVVMALASYYVNDPSGNNNNEADYGENISLNVSLNNLGVDTAKSVQATLSTSDSNVNITDSVQGWGNILAGITSTQNNAYSMSISNMLPDQYHVSFNLNIEDNTSYSWNSVFNMTINAPELSVGSFIVDDSNLGNNDGRIDPGETFDLIVQTSNTGHSNCFNTVSSLSTTNTYLTLQNSTYSLDTIQYGTFKNAIFTISVSSSIPIGNIIDLTFNVSSGAYYAQKYYTEKAGIVDEDFETGNFTQFNWDNSSIQPWTITTTDPYEGSYCSKSGAISHSQTSELLITCDIANADSISFYKKVSCEESPSASYTYDFLEFLIDSNPKDWWDGEIAWSRESYYVTAGTHTFTWKYEKDFMESAGSDCAWVDYIVFPPLADVTGIEGYDSPETFFSIYPNPVKESAIVQYAITSASFVNISIYNSIGQQVKKVFEKDHMLPGVYSLEINVADLESGLFYVRLDTGKGSKVEKLIIAE